MVKLNSNFISKLCFISLAKIGSEVLERMLWIWFSSLQVCGFVENLVEICQMKLTEKFTIWQLSPTREGHHFSVLFSTRMLCVLFGQIDPVSSRKIFFKWQMDRHRTKWDQRFGSNKLSCLFRIYVIEHPNLINRHFIYKTQNWLFFRDFFKN